MRGRMHGTAVPGAAAAEGLLLVHGLEVLDQVQYAPTLVVRDSHQTLHASAFRLTVVMVCLIFSAYSHLNKLQHYWRTASAPALDWPKLRVWIAW